MSIIYGKSCTNNIFNDLSDVFVTYSTLLLSIALDKEDNLFLGNVGLVGFEPEETSPLGYISILPNIDISYGTIFCPANQATSLSGLDVSQSISLPTSIAIDTNGTLFISSMDFNQQSKICVLPRVDISLYGTDYSANIVTQLNVDCSGLGIITSLAIDEQQNLFIGAGFVDGFIFFGEINDISEGFVYVLPHTTTTLFGTICPANILTQIAREVGSICRSIIFDSNKNLFVGFLSGSTNTEPNTLCGSLYIIPSSPPNVLTKLYDLGDILPGKFAIDAYDNLFIGPGFLSVQRGVNQPLYILPSQNTTLYGQYFPGNTLTSISGTGFDVNNILQITSGIAFDSHNNLFVSNNIDILYATIVVLPKEQNVSASFSTPVFGYYYATEYTYLFTQSAIKQLVAGIPRRGEQLQPFPPIGTPLRDLHRRIFAFGRNKLKTYEFHEVQRMDTLESGYLCVWAASGVSPSIV